MQRFVLSTVVPALIAFGAGIAVGTVLTPISKASPQAAASGVSPEAIHRAIDARTLPETEVRDFN